MKKLNLKNIIYYIFMAFALVFISYNTYNFINAKNYQLVKVSGHSMDPTFYSDEKLQIKKTKNLKRFDIVVANEKEKKQTTKDYLIIKRLIGLPGDTITYKNDTLYINGKIYKESYLNNYINQLKSGKLDETYSKINSNFGEIADSTEHFTLDENRNSEFSITLKNNEYYLLGDNRLLSLDSRHVGTFSKSEILGKYIKQVK